MKTSFVSTYSLANTFRTSLPRLQSELMKAGTEVSTSRHADVGLALGTRTTSTLRLRHDFSALESQIDTNGLVASQLKRSQAALTQISVDANSFLQALVVPSISGIAAQFESQAAAALSGLIAHLNLADGQRYLFGGINTDTKPMAEFSGAPKLAIDTAFAAAFGLSMPDPQSDPAVATIDPAAMTAFLEGDFAALFEEPAWSANWSSASDTNLSSSISANQKIETSVNANEPALRKLAMAYSMVSALGLQNLPGETFNAIATKAREVVGSALFDLSGVQAKLGFAEERVASATKRMAMERDIVTEGINALEGVDPVEAKIRLDTLSTQLETSYAVTTRILGMSILNYA